MSNLTTAIRAYEIAIGWLSDPETLRVKLAELTPEQHGEVIAAMARCFVSLNDDGPIQDCWITLQTEVSQMQSVLIEQVLWDAAFREARSGQYKTEQDAFARARLESAQRLEAAFAAQFGGTK